MAKRNKVAASNKSTSSPQAKAAHRRSNITPVPVSEVNGECGNGKLRCKSLIIDGTKYRTRLNYKFENRRSWEYPDPKKVTSLIPGTIIKIFVEEGQEVKMGEQMLILEAMKMKNRIMFHADGNVKRIYVKEGERVPKDFLMLELT